MNFRIKIFYYSQFGMIIARFAKHVFVWKMSDDYLDQFWIFYQTKKSLAKFAWQQFIFTASQFANPSQIYKTIDVLALQCSNNYSSNFLITESWQFSSLTSSWTSSKISFSLFHSNWFKIIALFLPLLQSFCLATYQISTWLARASSF